MVLAYATASFVAMPLCAAIRFSRCEAAMRYAASPMHHPGTIECINVALIAASALPS